MQSIPYDDGDDNIYVSLVPRQSHPTPYSQCTSFFLREYIPYSYTGKTNNYCQKWGGETIIGLLKKVVWTFPERNGKIIGCLVGIPAVTVNLCQAD